MPLERATGQPHTDMNDVRFPMQDTKTKVRVFAKVSFDYIEDRSRQEADDHTDPLDLFLDYRESIEEIASHLYDGGMNPPSVTTADLP